MLKVLVTVATLAVLLVGASTPLLASVAIPDGTLTASGVDDYAYSISTASIDAQSAETHVTGTVTGYTLPHNNAGWFTIGLITEAQRDRALVTYGVPSYMFNQAVFMMGMNSGADYRVMPSDYAGDFAGGVGQSQSVGPSFTFDLKLMPNVGGTGGTAYLAIDGGAYGAGLAYGRDNWNNYNWSFPPEDLSKAYLVAQLYTYDSGSPNAYSVTMQGVTASTVPEPLSFAVWSLLGALGIGVAWRRRRTG